MPEDALDGERCSRFLRQHNGSIVSSLDKSDDGKKLVVVIPKPQSLISLAEHYNREIKACLIDKLKLTYDKFRSLVILSEAWAAECVN